MSANISWDTTNKTKNTGEGKGEGSKGSCGLEPKRCGGRDTLGNDSRETYPAKSGRTDSKFDKTWLQVSLPSAFDSH